MPQEAAAGPPGLVWDLGVVFGSMLLAAGAWPRLPEARPGLSAPARATRAARLGASALASRRGPQPFLASRDSRCTRGTETVLPTHSPASLKVRGAPNLGKHKQTILDMLLLDYLTDEDTCCLEASMKQMHK